MLVLRLPAEIEARLEALAERTGRTTSFHALEAILEHLDDLEDRHLAEDALAEHRAGGIETLSMSEVLKRFG